MIRVVVVVTALLAACGDDTVTGPFDNLRLDLDLTVVGLNKPVHVARDEYGIAHINAQSLADAAFAQGYVMAHDRLPQMDILRRFGAGTLSELFGALDPGVIDTDLEMRMHRMKPLARETLERLRASDLPEDQQVVLLLERFADGVNAYAAQVRSEANPQGAWELDANLLASFDASRFVAWDPVDSLVLGRFQAFALSWTAPFELDATELDQKLRTTFEQATAADPAAFARHGISRDLLKFTPVGQVPTIDGFPNISDSGTRSDSGRPRRKPNAAAAGPVRPTVPQPVLDNARRFFQRGIHSGAFGALGPHAFMQPYAGSNNWAVHGARTQGGAAILASDQHLQLPNPSIFYPTHITIAAGEDDPVGVDVIGVTFPGIPGVILGSNGKIAWSGTVSEHDVNDVYLETIAPCGARSCVTFGGAPVPIETFTEEIKIGALGTITQTKMATYEVVPHHGPIIPTINETTHELVPRPAGTSTAMSVRYTGHVPTYEIRALWKLGHARTIDEGFTALHDFGYGSQNWTMIDSAQNIGWTTHADVPVRQPAAYTWNAATNPTGLAPFFVLPSEGAEWSGMMSSRYVPHAINPAPPRDYLVSANADPVGATFDGDPLNQSDADGNPLYVGVTYAAGVRHERIAEMIATNPGPITIEDMARMQHDTKSTMGTKLTPYLVAVLGQIEAPGAAPADLAPYISGLSAADRARLIQARTLLAAWTFQTPTGLDSSSELGDSAATAVFNAFMHFFVERTLRDEFTAADFDVWRLDDNLIARIVHAMIATPANLVQSATTLQPILCDQLTTAGPDDSCSKVLLQAMLDTMLHLESTAGFGTADVTKWQWGKLHRLKITPLFPNTELDLPAPGAPGFPKSGDNFVVNRSDQGWDDLDFSQSADGPAQRFLAIADGGEIRVKWALPGGVIYDSRSPHYRDLLDNYYLAQKHFDAPFLVSEIVAHGESRWLFR